MTVAVHTRRDCEKELEASPLFNRFACAPPVFTCSCGRVWHHACDEAEGCGWYPAADDESHITRGEE